MTEPSGPARIPGVSFGEVLFATDFSEVSALALPYAAAFARSFNVTLCIVHIVPSDEYAHLSESGRDAHLADMRRLAEERVSRLLRTAHMQGVRHQLLFDHGDILAALVRVVQRRNPGLIVLGMHGRHGVEKLLLGSLAEEILRLAVVPVLVICPEVVVAPEAEVHVRHILHLVDFSPGSRRALDYAALLTRQWNARLTLLHITEGIWNAPRATQMSGAEFLRLRLREQGWLEDLEGLTVDFVVEFGSAEDRVLQAALSLHAELIVLSLPDGGHPEVASHLPGPIAYNIASHACCPVLVVRAAAEAGSE